MWGQKNKERKRKENWEYKLSGKLWRVNVLALKNLLEAFLLLTLIIILCLLDISDLILSVLWRRSESNANESYRWSRLLFRGKVMTDEVSPGQIYRCPVEGDACARCLWQKTRISLQRDDVRTFRSQEPFKIKQPAQKQFGLFLEPTNVCVVEQTCVSVANDDVVLNL